ncbi:hypothetical protein [uncultured Nostoc sp.]|uniref:hypothetical protein n=1 Tax=uncultured Nostoc sp. TaxID=340711 RepID=UPI0035CC5723
MSSRKRDYRDKQITTVSDVQEAAANVRAATADLRAAESKRNRYENVAKVGALSQDQFEEEKSKTNCRCLTKLGLTQKSPKSLICRTANSWRG